MLARVQYALVVFGACYVVLVALLTVPFFQKHAIFMHAVRWPLFANFDLTAKYNLPVHRTLNLRITTSDNITLGAWLVFPTNALQKDDQPTVLLPKSTPTTSEVDLSISTRPTILYFHGNAASRAVSFRVQAYTSYTARFGANVLVIDYRGYADSGGTPSEIGLGRDARAAWDYLIAHGAKPQDVLIVGQSLGTGVSAALANELSQEGVQPKGVVLLAPFTSLDALLVDYNLFGFIPLLRPLDVIPFATTLITKFVRHHFDTQSVLPNIKTPILIAHSRDDFDIPYFHSLALFNKLLERHIPPLPPLPTSPVDISQADWDEYQSKLLARRVGQAQLVRKQKIDGFGEISTFDNSPGNAVVYVETLWGGHDRIGIQEGVMDLMARMFNLTYGC
ncbi:alpha/beta-hydrolase [Rickenella mellea]|uniref:Alpha/beta-hydrolase n=1 Tax=Rickenella mellea TaxID=50990 RepID=A0A4Y7Q4B5_9AGAM|nr:alpha/beta-hydrolase [Rickenella mellea]